MMKKQVLNAITQMRIAGKKPTEIANTLGISVNTVKSHILNIVQFVSQTVDVTGSVTV